jgi:general secretion pathway protein B
MSYILDALRKSEQERQQVEPLVLNPIGSDAIELPRRRLGPLTGVAAVVVFAAAVGVYGTFLAGRPGGAPENMSATAPAESFKVGRPLPAPIPEEVRPAPELKPSPFATAPRRSTVRDLSQEARVEPPRAPVPQLITAPQESAPTVATAAPPPMPAESANEPIKFLRAMPAEFQRELPDLRVTIHIYAPRPADRILYINDRQYHVGDQVRDGVVVEAIVEDGVVLRFHGQRFKLPRPT